MRRSGRHKFIRISVFFLVYSIIHIVSVRSDNKDAKLQSTSTTTATKTTSQIRTSMVPGKNKQNSKAENALLYPKKINELINLDVSPSENSKMEHGMLLVESAVGKVSEMVKKDNETTSTHQCTPAAIRQFPRPIMSQQTRRHGGIIIHIIVAIYMFIGLAIVCDEYFVASLDRICEELKMSPDVAGATFMAAGSSAPELATVIIGVFYAEDDIGISGVIGSAVFNIMFVISVCALATGTMVYLNWWPLIRDSTFYAISILVMLAVIVDEDVNWFESTVMLVIYAIYCVVLHFNPVLEKWAHTLPVPFKSPTPNEQSGLVSYKNLENDNKPKPASYGIEYNSFEQPQPPLQETSQWSPGNEWSPEKYPAQTFHTEPLSGPDLNQATTDIPVPQQQVQPVVAPIQQDYYKPKEYDPSAKVNPLLKPADEAGLWQKTKWAVLYPIHFFCIYTMPDCRSETYRNWYPFTFFVSMLWISFYSYFMVWMITIIGYTMGVPDTVMGLTFVAAGVSVPDALSSIAVIKEGYGDMAVSNAIGSNVFDILVCLGLPWFMKTALTYPGSHIKVISKGLTYSTLSLLSTVAFLVIAVHCNGWKLDRKFGIVLMIWYLLFITFASLYELNVFGYMNPPECLTDY
ncbi:probable sodium/potassium/calcium exchanger CG1090 [Euwallacea fornicatus]|uniref:probable sodium/potassium/calcium exchanger CG1090 n=1 Tax=Euwallacea fornicatus TaxID=995702 RepID=UPI00338E4866